MKETSKRPGAQPSKKDGIAKPGPYGEGNYDATRQYNEGMKEHVREHDIEKEARDAAPRTAAEEKEMKEAERFAKSKTRGEDETQSEKREDSPKR